MACRRIETRLFSLVGKTGHARVAQQPQKQVALEGYPAGLEVQKRGAGQAGLAGELAAEDPGILSELADQLTDVLGRAGGERVRREKMLLDTPGEEAAAGAPVMIASAVC